MHLRGKRHAVALCCRPPRDRLVPSLRERGEGGQAPTAARVFVARVSARPRANGIVVGLALASGALAVSDLLQVNNHLTHALPAP